MELQSCFHFLPALSWYRHIALADRHVAWMQQVKMYHCLGLHAMGFVPHNGEGRPAGQCETERGPVSVSHWPQPDPFRPALWHAWPAWTELPDGHRSTKGIQNRKPARRIVGIVRRIPGFLGNLLYIYRRNCLT